MAEVIVITVFFASIVIGGLVANALGRLPDAEALEAEDRARNARFQRGR